MFSIDKNIVQKYDGINLWAIPVFAAMWCIPTVHSQEKPIIINYLESNLPNVWEMFSVVQRISGPHRQKKHKKVPSEWLVRKSV